VTTSSGANTQLLGGLATIERAASNAVVSHYNVRPVIDIFATPQGAISGGIAVDIRKADAGDGHDVPNGASVVTARQGHDNDKRLPAALYRSGAGFVLIYLLIVVNFSPGSIPSLSSWRCRLRWPACLDAVREQYTLSFPRSRAIMCMASRPPQHPGDQLRAGTSGGRC